MLDCFDHLLPEVIFEAAEVLGGQCTGRFLILNAMENRVYEIEMEGGEKRIIKFYRPGRWGKDTLLAEHAFLEALEKNEIPVVCPMKSEKGETLFLKNEIYYTIFPKRQGRLEPELNKEQLERLGRFLARLHNVGESFPKVDRPHLDVKTFGRDALQVIVETGLLPQTSGPRFIQIIEQLCAAIEPILKGAPHILLHGDCHSGNLLWNQNAPFFIDFDDMLYAPAVQDIWMLTGGDDDYAKENREILIESYEQIRSFDGTTLRWIEPLRSLRMIHFNAWIAKRRNDGAFKMAFPAFGSERYWQEQIEGLSVQLEKLHY